MHAPPECSPSRKLPADQAPSPHIGEADPFAPEGTDEHLLESEHNTEHNLNQDCRLKATRVAIDAVISTNHEQMPKS